MTTKDDYKRAVNAARKASDRAAAACKAVYSYRGNQDRRMTLLVSKDLACSAADAAWKLVDTLGRDLEQARKAGPGKDRD